MIVLLIAALVLLGSDADARAADPDLRVRPKPSAAPPVSRKKKPVRPRAEPPPEEEREEEGGPPPPAPSPPAPSPAASAPPAPRSKVASLLEQRRTGAVPTPAPAATGLPDMRGTWHFTRGRGKNHGVLEVTRQGADGRLGGRFSERGLNSRASGTVTKDRIEVLLHYRLLIFKGSVKAVADLPPGDSRPKTLRGTWSGWNPYDLARDFEATRAN